MRNANIWSKLGVGVGQWVPRGGKGPLWVQSISLHDPAGDPERYCRGEAKQV